jgi:hypothetical protein
MWVKIVERGGDNLKNICKSNPTGKKECERKNCKICEGDKPGRCDTAGIGYRCICKECEKNRKKGILRGRIG